MGDLSIPLLEQNVKGNKFEPSIGRRFHVNINRRFYTNTTRKPCWMLRPLSLKRCVVAVTILCILSIIYLSHYVFHSPLSR